MKPILIESGFEAWAAAIRFCDKIKDGKATLQNQKNFVASLHNAVELIMKQMMLNNNDHRVAEVRKPKTEIDANLLLDYFKATDLNNFFDLLTNDELSKFNTIQFYELISLHKKLFGQSLEQDESLETELKLLQQLRNNETYFMIRKDSFLSEEDFCVLHNFMIRFYKIMETWCPNDKDNIELYILPYWGEPTGADSIYGFNREPLEKFSYESAVRNSSWAKKIAALLNDGYLYDTLEFSPYTIAKDLIEEHTELSSNFDEIWAMVYMMQWLKMIVVDEILDDEQGQVYFVMNVRI